ncbi:single-strand DNA-binding protein [Crossiella equi]|uniref:Single-strand DNA-binding protein n=1 Tax=Crossiella equi TaxID=130796 RepID=A0ABS5ACD5_9PSEU|nr:single-stranded DNA-binding protein [Crossiella equi]MBP2474244.1 single-strand DNA-binding protein [Crossiella equi]
MFETPATVIGRVVSDVESRHTPNGHLSTNFRVISRTRRFDRERQEWTDGEHLAVRVQCWGELAESAALTLRKGDPVLVTGSLSTREYDAADGSRRVSVELRASAAGPNLRHCSADLLRPATAQPEDPAAWSPTRAAVLQSARPEPVGPEVVGPEVVSPEPVRPGAAGPEAVRPECPAPPVRPEALPGAARSGVLRPPAPAPVPRPPAQPPSHIPEQPAVSARVKEAAARSRRSLAFLDPLPEEPRPEAASTAA